MNIAAYVNKKNRQAMHATCTFIPQSFSPPRTFHLAPPIIKSAAKLNGNNFLGSFTYPTTTAVPTITSGQYPTGKFRSVSTNSTTSANANCFKTEIVTSTNQAKIQRPSLQKTRGTQTFSPTKLIFQKHRTPRIQAVCTNPASFLVDFSYMLLFKRKMVVCTLHYHICINSSIVLVE